MSVKEKNIIDVVVMHILNTTFEDLDTKDVEWAKKVVLDYFCSVLAGHCLDECRTVQEEVGTWTTDGNFSIHFRSEKTIQPFAALVNGTLARSADLDDVYEDGFLQVYGHILPPLFVAAESMESCNGKQFITALNVGADINCRLASANNEPCTVSGRYNLFKIFGAVAAVAKLLEFNEEELRNALGISFGIASGELQGLREGAFSCLLASGGFSAINTIFSILFSKRNIHGTRDIFEGQYGFLNAFEADVDKHAIIKDIGVNYYGKKSSIKLYPSSRATHAGIDAAIEIIKENRIDIAKIEKVDIEMFDFCYNIVGSPIEDKQNPKSSEQAKFSYPFCVACALSGTPMLKLLDEKTIQNKQIRELCKKVSTRVNKELKKFQARVNVILTTGENFYKEILKCKGHPDNPLYYTDVQQKFLESVNYAKEKGFELNPSVPDFLFNYIQNIESQLDLHEINKKLI